MHTCGGQRIPSAVVTYATATLCVCTCAQACWQVCAPLSSSAEARGQYLRVFFYPSSLSSSSLLLLETGLFPETQAHLSTSLAHLLC